MGFPFVTPVRPWIKEVMEERESNLISSMYKTPFVRLISGARVVKGETSGVISPDEKGRIEAIKSVLAGECYDQGYAGCIISNNSNDIGLSYSLNQTPIGYDLNGKLIVSEGEVGRKISTPIIESIEIDTDGANNTLKTAAINIKCFSLKQLEMFGMFFMIPGMNVMLEYGDSTLLAKQNIFSNRYTAPTNPITVPNKYKRISSDGRILELTPYTKIDEALIKFKDYEDFCGKFNKYFIANFDDLSDQILNTERALGSYDFVAGIITDYSFTISQDGVYEVMIEVSQANQITMAIPKNQSNSSGKSAAASKPTTNNAYDAASFYNDIIETITLDFGLDKKRLMDVMKNKSSIEVLTNGSSSTNRNDWSGDFYNFFQKKSETVTVQTQSDEPYLSLRFILQVLVNYYASTNFENDVNNKNMFHLKLPKYKNGEGDKLITIIPVFSDKDIISSNDLIIFPTNELPTFVVGSDKKDENKIIVSPKDRKDGRINNYNFHTNIKSLQPSDSNCRIDFNQQQKNRRIGDALNIFIKYSEVLSCWNQNVLRIDFIESILNIVNKNSYGLFSLHLNAPHQGGQNTIIDHKFCNKIKEVTPKLEKEEIYRFKPTTINSIVKEFNFNFEMTNEVAGMTMFNSGRYLNDVLSGSLDQDKKNLIVPDKVYKQINPSSFVNIDGWFSFNKVDFDATKETATQAKTQTEPIKNIELKVDTKTTSKPENVLDTINRMTVLFPPIEIKKDPKDSKKQIVSGKPLIFMNPSLITDNIRKNKIADKDNSQQVLTPIDISLKIDGFAGLRCGECFEIDGIPEIYNKIGVFQTMNIKHEISTEGWSTIIEASWLYS